MHHGACLMNVGVARRLHGTVAVLPGVRTGECVTSIDHPPNKTCEIYGWCPVEQDALPLYEFTLFAIVSVCTLLIWCMCDVVFHATWRISPME